ncbi:hypothetical protein B0H17DRAFT_1330253 [Mycena rosella]|uniref:Uncharacterized protein n=1 Tax=Mycena rosella TaxID=1033263 RepID=A0AAD7DNR6_MYCRO|nr:hypothetical protein B0H17DRAFT_1330253 [Mycena rosella]
MTPDTSPRGRHQGYPEARGFKELIYSASGRLRAGQTRQALVDSSRKWRLRNATLKDAVLENLSKECISSSKPADRMTENISCTALTRINLRRLLWNLQLTARCSCSTTLSPLRRRPSKISTATTRKGSTTPPFPLAQAEVSTIFNLFVNVDSEFTRTDRPTLASNPLVGASAGVGKYQQAITNADDLLTFQPTRLFVPTLSASILPSIASKLGYNPLFAYSFIFHASGLPARAQLLESLVSLLPIAWDAVDSANHAAVLSSLEGLMGKTVAAVDSVDTCSLAREI